MIGVTLVSCQTDEENPTDFHLEQDEDNGGNPQASVYDILGPKLDEIVSKIFKDMVRKKMYFIF